MVTIVFIDHDGRERVVEAKAGVSLMEAAVANNVPGIEADCGGSCACGTCQVYVDEAWRVATGEAGEAELTMLEFVEGVRPGSRLSCQIEVTKALHGLIVRTPEGQN